MSNDKKVDPMKQANDFVEENLFQLAKDVSHLGKIGVYPENSIVFDLVEILRPISPNQCDGLAKRIIEIACVDTMAKQADENQEATGKLEAMREKSLKSMESIWNSDEGEKMTPNKSKPVNSVNKEPKTCNHSDMKFSTVFNCMSVTVHITPQPLPHFWDIFVGKWKVGELLLAVNDEGEGEYFASDHNDAKKNEFNHGPFKDPFFACHYVLSRILEK